jgi:hypothetical protein|tara:strand:+ start:348 stop:620 length:273 start_codon:yes stop_codon:yes gene_type:complete
MSDLTKHLGPRDITKEVRIDVKFTEERGAYLELIHKRRGEEQEVGCLTLNGHREGFESYRNGKGQIYNVKFLGRGYFKVSIQDTISAQTT